MTVNGTSGGTLNTLLASHNNLGGGLAERAAGGHLGDEQPRAWPGGDYYGGLLQEGDWRGRGG